MKVLSLNAGYFLGYEGTMRDYICHPLRAVIGDKVVQSRKVSEFSKLVHDTDPDTVLLQEVDQGSIRSSDASLPRSITRKLPGEFSVHPETKYREGFRKMPFVRNMSNALLTKEGNVHNHRVDTGTKCLVQELQLENLSIFSVHLSRFGKSVRRKQLKQISELVEGRENYIVAGDFNFMDPEEQKTAEEIIGKKFSAGATFPAKKPTRTLDMAYTSESLDLNLEVIDSEISDHRPIIMDINQ
ncbi:hypothetical protein GKQ38_02120 [Candidatus Nanohaloarchaea archaeon]|nr:hypothetical protein GKQ38_02120 [Candidatus Nanohaloarchaea archaeon]